MSDDLIAITDKRGAAERATAFFDAWLACLNGDRATEFEIRIGITTEGEGAVLVTLGADAHAMRASEARITAGIILDAMTRFPDHSGALVTLRLMLLDAAAHAEAAITKEPRH